jgi:uncharacterized protein YjbI with pentapeptide repeats
MVTVDSELRWRWDTPEGLVRAGEVLGRLRAGQPLEVLGLGEVSGRVDLRGFPAGLPRPVTRADVPRWRAGDGLIQGVTLRGLDLSGAVLDQMTFRDCVIEDCVLDGAHAHDLAIARSRVRDTSLRGAGLRGAVLGPWRAGAGNEYARVSFAGADLLRANSVTAWLRDCDFSGARLKETGFARCGLVRCRFSGLLADVGFNGNGRCDEGEPNYCEEVDMADAVFRNVVFRGFDLDAVTLPDDPGLWVIRDYPRVARKAVAALEGRQDKAGGFLLFYLTDRLRGIDSGHPLGLLNRNDLVTYGGEELARLAESVIRQAESA